MIARAKPPPIRTSGRNFRTSFLMEWKYLVIEDINSPCSLDTLQLQQ